MQETEWSVRQKMEMSRARLRKLRVRGALRESRAGPPLLQPLWLIPSCT